MYYSVQLNQSWEYFLRVFGLRQKLKNGMEIEL